MDLWQRMGKAVSKGLATTQEIYAKTRDKAKDMSDQAVLKIQISQLEKQIEKRFTKLGAKVYGSLVLEGKATISKKNVEVASLLDEVKSMEREIAKRESELAKLQAKA